MKLEFGNLEHILLVKELQVRAIGVISDISKYFDEDVDIVDEINKLSIECQNIRNEIRYRAGQEIPPIVLNPHEHEYPYVDFEVFTQDFWYP